ESGARRVHRHETKALAAGRQGKAGQGQAHPQDEEGRKIAEHVCAQQRRPSEGKESADAANGEGENEGEGKTQTDASRAQSFAGTFQAEADNPLLDAFGRAPEQGLQQGTKTEKGE